MGRSPWAFIPRGIAFCGLVKPWLILKIVGDIFFLRWPCGGAFWPCEGIGPGLAMGKLITKVG